MNNYDYFTDKDAFSGAQFSDSGEIDLHDYSTGVAIAVFVNYYNDCVGCREIKVIHGHGSSGQGGIIRQMLRTYLSGRTTVKGG